MDHISSAAGGHQDNTFSSSTLGSLVQACGRSSPTSRSTRKNNLAPEVRDYIGMSRMGSSFGLDSQSAEGEIPGNLNLRGTDLKLGLPGAPPTSHSAEAQGLDQQFSIGGRDKTMEMEGCSQLTFDRMSTHSMHEFHEICSYPTATDISETKDSDVATQHSILRGKRDCFVSSCLRVKEANRASTEYFTTDIVRVPSEDQLSSRGKEDATRSLHETLVLFHASKGRERTDHTVSGLENSFPGEGLRPMKYDDLSLCQSTCHIRPRIEDLEESGSVGSFNGGAEAQEIVDTVLTTSTKGPRMHFLGANSTGFETAFRPYQSHTGYTNSRLDARDTFPVGERGATADYLNHSHSPSTIVLEGRGCGFPQNSSDYQRAWFQASTSQMSHPANPNLETAAYNNHLSSCSLEAVTTSERSGNCLAGIQSLPADDGCMIAADQSNVVGWPPVNYHRKNSSQVSNSRVINEIAIDGDATSARADPAARPTHPSRLKVKMDEAPYMRKVDLNRKNGYEDLCVELENLFEPFVKARLEAEGESDPANRSRKLQFLHGPDYVLTYEDGEGDWMLAGDMPWEMFTQSAKKIRIMKRSW